MTPTRLNRLLLRVSSVHYLSVGIGEVGLYPMVFISSVKRKPFDRVRTALSPKLFILLYITETTYNKNLQLDCIEKDE